MILASLSQSERYAALHPLFARAFEFARTTDLLALAPGKHAIAGDELFVIAESSRGRSREDAKLECHRRYIDIQLVLEGNEEMGWKALADCHTPLDEYSAEKDIRFFGDAVASWVAVPPGSFCIFFPEDAHAPLVAPAPRNSPIRKVIFKVAVNAAQGRSD